MEFFSLLEIAIRLPLVNPHSFADNLKKVEYDRVTKVISAATAFCSQGMKYAHGT